MKQCRRCRQNLPLDQFNRNRTASDGLQSRCRICQHASNREWREAHPERVRERMRRQEAVREHRRPSRTVSPAAQRAHRRVYNAVRAGRLTRPSACPTCGTTQSPIQAHHEDYSRPLDVQWLCARCHQRLHAEVAA